MTCAHFRLFCGGLMAPLGTLGVAHTHFLSCTACRYWLEEATAAHAARDPEAAERAKRLGEAVAKAYREVTGQ